MKVYDFDEAEGDGGQVLSFIILCKCNACNQLLNEYLIECSFLISKLKERKKPMIPKLSKRL